jgi:NDP-sugar pyrophosphorylase family protein
LINDLPEQFLVINGDLLTDIDFAAFMAFHASHDAMLSVACHKRVDKIEYGALTIADDGSVVEFQEKPTIEWDVSMGVYAFDRELLDYIPDNQPFGFDNLMYMMLDRSLSVMTYRYDGFWLDIGRVEDYHRALEKSDEIKRLLG